MKHPMHSEPTRMPRVAKAFVYLRDLQEAVMRLSAAWNSSQVEEALSAIQYWHNKIDEEIKRSEG